MAATTGIGIVAGTAPEATTTIDTLVRTHISCAAIIAPVPVRLIVDLALSNTSAANGLALLITLNVAVRLNSPAGGGREVGG